MFSRQMGVFYTGLYGGASIHLKLPHHLPALFVRSYPVVNNLLLLAVFFGTHSLLARGWMKKVFSPVVSESLYRQLYFLVSSVTLLQAAYGWSPLPHGVWHVQSSGLRLSFYCLQVCGAAVIVVSFFSLKPLEFCGLQKPINQLLGTRCYRDSCSGDRGTGDGQLTVSGVYGWARHPMYTGVLIFLWSQPTMTQGQMLLAIATTLYLLLVVPWLEEPDLIEQFGHKYLDYMNTTGMFFPCPLTHTKKLK
jgi:hypothetical protein